MDFQVAGFFERSTVSTDDEEVASIYNVSFSKQHSINCNSKATDQSYAQQTIHNMMFNPSSSPKTVKPLKSIGETGVAQVASGSSGLLFTVSAK